LEIRISLVLTPRVARRHERASQKRPVRCDTDQSVSAAVRGDLDGSTSALSVAIRPASTAPIRVHRWRPPPCLSVFIRGGPIRVHPCSPVAAQSVCIRVYPWRRAHPWQSCASVCISGTELHSRGATLGGARLHCPDTGMIRPLLTAWLALAT